MDVTGAGEYEALSPSDRQIILDTDMKIATTDYLSTLEIDSNVADSLRDLIDFTRSHPGQELPQRNPEGLERAEATYLESAVYRNMLTSDAYIAGEGRIPGSLTRYRCNGLLFPNLSVHFRHSQLKQGVRCLACPWGNTHQKLK